MPAEEVTQWITKLVDGDQQAAGRLCLVGARIDVNQRTPFLERIAPQCNAPRL